MNLKNHKLIKNKKGMSQMWWIISVAIISFLIVILILVWFRGSGESAFSDIDQRIGGLQDADNDHVADMFDKCPESLPNEEVNSNGCSERQLQEKNVQASLPR